MPNSGLTVEVSSKAGIWDRRGSPRQAVYARIAQYWSLSRLMHTGVRVRATLIEQSRPWIYNLEPVMPRGYEGERVDAKTLIGADAEIIQPLWFVENGFVLVPAYFEALYAYGFAEWMYGRQTARTYRSVGAGLGLQLRFAHYLQMDLRAGLAYLPDTGQVTWTLR